MGSSRTCSTTAFGVVLGGGGGGRADTAANLGLSITTVLECGGIKGGGGGGGGGRGKAPNDG